MSNTDAVAPTDLELGVGVDPEVMLSRVISASANKQLAPKEALHVRFQLKHKIVLFLIGLICTVSSNLLETYHETSPVAKAFYGFSQGLGTFALLIVAILLGALLPDDTGAWIRQRRETLNI